jgi:HipA-like protein
MNKDLSTILEVLIEEKSYLSLKEITLKFKHKKPELRTMQRELSKLVSTNRISQSGQASSTRYIIDEIPRNYPSSKFLYVYKSSIIVGLLFKLKDRFRFYYDSGYLAKYNEEIPTIELSVEPFDFETIPAVFEENIPEGINREILETIHKEADEFEILALMDEAEENIVESGALPTTEHFMVNPSKIGDIIGKAGATIRDIIEKFEVSIDLDRDEGGVKLSGEDKEKVAAAKEHIKSIADAPVRKQMVYEVGKSYEGKIKKIVDFGLFVEMPDGFDALLHISKVAKERVNNLPERYNEGDEITVVVMEQKGKKVELATPAFLA